jgi:predicted metal-dependent hydrolase
MQVTTSIQGTPIEYTHKYVPRSRRIRVTMYPGGRIVVATPKRTGPHDINKFLEQKAAWLLRNLARLKQAPAHDPAVSRQEYLKHKATALRLITERVRHFNAIYGFQPGRISVKNHRTLWGSCSRRGNLNFNYKLALLPAAHADYVIVHELCHLAEFNHSARFWALVARAIPDHLAIRKELKKIGLTLP